VIDAALKFRDEHASSGLQAPTYEPRDTDIERTEA
jgi:hypothetical protein